MASWKEKLLDEMGAANAVEVRPLGSTPDGAEYEISFSVKFDRATLDEIGAAAAKSGRRVTSMLGKFARHGLRRYLSTMDDDAPAFADRVADKIATRHGE